MTSKYDNTERKAWLAYAIKYYRQQKGYTQEELAELLDVSRQHIAAAESPSMNRGISLDLLFNIAAALETEPYLLLKFRIET